MINSKEKKIIDKHIIGQKIKSVKWLTPKETEQYFGWHYQPVEIELENGVLLNPSADDEGNNGGAISTNIRNFETIYVTEVDDGEEV